jgi:protein TonB
MFETVAPEKFAPRSRKLFYETLPLSIAFHALIGGAAVLATTWRVVFPGHTPPMIALYRLEAVPTPPPPPPPPAAPPKRVQTLQPVVKMPENVAPSIIPEQVPDLTQPPPSVEFTEGIEGGIEGGIETGIVGGSPTGVAGGEVGGVEGGTIGGIVDQPADTVIVKRDMPLPTAPMSMVFPRYPEEARVRGWEDTVVVRYVIGTNGRVRDIMVLSKPERELFEKITLKAIRNWRFKPLIKDGVPQEIVHELTIYYRLNA